MAARAAATVDSVMLAAGTTMWAPTPWNPSSAAMAARSRVTSVRSVVKRPSRPIRTSLLARLLRFAGPHLEETGAGAPAPATGPGAAAGRLDGERPQPGNVELDAEPRPIGE